MLKLIRYELKKTWFVKMIVLAVTGVLEAAFLIGLYTDHEGTTMLSTIFLTLLAFGGVFVIGLWGILTLHLDLNTRRAYLLFMTPNSGYKILGAKLLECGLSVLLTGAFFFGLGALDITLLFARQGQLKEVWNLVEEVLEAIRINGRNLSIDLNSLAALTFTLLTSWIATVTTAFLADVTGTALLSGRKFNWLICFVLFIVLSLAESWLLNALTVRIPSVATGMWVSSLISLALAAGMYVASSELADRKLSV